MTYASVWYYSAALCWLLQDSLRQRRGNDCGRGADDSDVVS